MFTLQEIAPMAERFHRRHLPHYDVSHATYFVTACLAGSIPASGLLHLRRQGEILARSPRPAGVTPRDWNRQRQFQLFTEGEEWLDQRPGTRWLQDRRLASIMQAAILYQGANRCQSADRCQSANRCDVHAYVVMPSHIHLVFTPRDDAGDISPGAAPPRHASRRSAIMHSLKLYTANACNRLLGRQGAFWQSESYDRVVRDERELERLVRYVEFNPVKAGLCRRPEEWEFSSAFAGRLL